MKHSNMTILIHLLTIQCLFYLCGGYDFFYLVLQWSGSYCAARESGCCFPTKEKPAAHFNIHGLWPNFNDGAYPLNCNARSPYNKGMISDLISGMQENWPRLACPRRSGSLFWAHECWTHGTCSESILDQHDYFEAALQIKDKVNLLKILQDAGIHPYGHFYSLKEIESALTPIWVSGVECNREYASGNYQLFQIYLCVHKSGKHLTLCPVKRNRKCPRWGRTIKFPRF